MWRGKGREAFAGIAEVRDVENVAESMITNSGTATASTSNVKKFMHVSCYIYI